MELSRGILKNFAEITNDTPSENKTTSVHATAVVSNGKKYAQIDGSNVLTPIAEATDVQTGDRILVTVENHTAVVIGNFSYPPSLRESNKALEESERASSTANSAIDKATEAQSLASEANTLSSQANASASQAVTSAQEASSLAQNAQAVAADANTKADSAVASANSSLEASASAQKKLDALEAEVTTVKGDVADARAEAIASVNAVKEELSADYAKKTDVTTVEGSLKAEISKSVAELQSTMSEQYTAKSDSVALEERLQTQITQNADSISSVVTRTTQLETDTSEAQKEIDAAKASAASAQSAADAAQAAAKTAKDTADAAQTAANTAQANATAAQTAADAAKAKADAANTAAANAQTDLDNAKANLTEVTNRVGATEEEIAAAQQAVDDAQAAADQAIANAASANSAAATAQSAADKAKADAANAQSAADSAQTKADSASAAAATAQDAADKAQADADALKSRVTSCETRIDQNAEAITLRATKTELTNNYYNKTQTDTAIKVSADNIVSSVSATYQTKDAMGDYSTTAQMNSAISQSANSIKSEVSTTYATNATVGEVKTIAEQTADKFTWIVKSGTSATNFTLTDRTATLIAETISLNGNVKVNGDMLVSGSVTAEKIAAKAVTADKISVTSLEAICAKIGGFTIGSSAIYNNTTALAGAVNSVYLGTDGISCGTAFKVTKAGSLTATSGTVGGFTIGSSALYNNTTTLAGASDSVYLGTDGISCGTTFKVTKAGALTATSGTVGGFTLSSKELTNAASNSGIHFRYESSGYPYDDVYIGGSNHNIMVRSYDSLNTNVLETTIGGDNPYAIEIAWKYMTGDAGLQSGDSLFMDMFGMYKEASYSISMRNDWLPSVNNSYDLGSSGYKFKNIFVNNVFTTCIESTMVNGSGNKILECNASLYPGSTETYDLGTSSNVWRYTWSKTIRLGNGSSSSAAAINTPWSDGSVHDLLVRSNDGLTTSVGWAGTSSYATVLNLRSRTVKLVNSSGTSTLSDKRLKKDFRNLEAWENFYLDLEPIAYKYKDGAAGRNHIGFVAQQVEEALLNNGLTSNDFAGFIKYDVSPDDEDCWHGYKTEYGLIYTEFTALNTYMTQKNVQAIKDLRNRFTVLDGKVNSTYARMASAEERIDKLEKENAELKAEITQLKMAS